MRYYLYIFIALIFATSCKVQQQSKLQSASGHEIIILHTNDIHGNINELPRMAFIVDSIRKIHEDVFLLNAGDIFTGNPYVDMYEDKGFPVIDLMNDIGFQLSAFGNHEFDYGQEILVKRMNQAKFPFICGNIKSAVGTLQKPNATYQFKTKNNQIINIFSLIDNSANGLPESHPSKLKGLTFENGLETTGKCKYLAKNADLFIALTHLGIDADEKLAAQMPELDLIVGGHSHTLLDSGKVVNGVLIVQTGARAKFLGEVSLIVDKGKVVSKKSKLIPIKKGQNEDLKIKEKLAKYNKNPYFDEVLGKADEELNGKEELGAFVTDAYRAYGNFDMAFQNYGGIRISEMEKGDITRGLIYKLDPFGNGLVKIEMTFKEIKTLLINSYNTSKEIDLSVSGIHYNIITENGLAKDVSITDYQGNQLSPDKAYQVSMNDYILNTYKFDHQDIGKSLEITTAEVLIAFLKNNPLKYQGVKRSSVDGK